MGRNNIHVAEARSLEVRLMNASSLQGIVRPPIGWLKPNSSSARFSKSRNKGCKVQVRYWKHKPLLLNLSNVDCYMALWNNRLVSTLEMLLRLEHLACMKNQKWQTNTRWDSRVGWTVRACTFRCNDDDFGTEALCHFSIYRVA